MADNFEGEPSKGDDCDFEDRYGFSNFEIIDKDVGLKNAVRYRISSRNKSGYVVSAVVVISKIVVSTMSDGDVARPSHSIFVDIFLPPDLADDLYANLDEVWNRWVSRYGTKRAAWLWQWHAFHVVVGRGISKLLDVAHKIRKIVG